MRECNRFLECSRVLQFLEIFQRFRECLIKFLKYSKMFQKVQQFSRMFQNFAILEFFRKLPKFAECFKKFQHFLEFSRSVSKYHRKLQRFLEYFKKYPKDSKTSKKIPQFLQNPGQSRTLGKFSKCSGVLQKVSQIFRIFQNNPDIQRMLQHF